MKVEYDPERDLLYLYFKAEMAKSAETKTVMPGVYADFDRKGKIIGIEVLDASEVLGANIEFSLYGQGIKINKERTDSKRGIHRRIVARSD